MRKRFAFIVHDPMMLVHYRDVWQALGHENFVILTTKFFQASPEGKQRLGYEEFINYVKSNQLEVRSVDDVIRIGKKYKYSITNHVIAGNTKDPAISQHSILNRIKFTLNRIFSFIGFSRGYDFQQDLNQFLPLQVAQRHIRYMYGADISEAWSLQPWNSIYDIFLCHGVNDKRVLEEKFAGQTFVMGYPRYDSYFEENIDLRPIRHEMGIDPNKKTLLWMPTLSGNASTIPFFSEIFSKLRQEYNVIVRPHPLSFIQEPEFIELLENYNFYIDRDALRDMNRLFSIADWVLADYGGTPFSAIFLGKNVILLDSPEPYSDPINEGSSVLELRKYLPVFQSHQYEDLSASLASAEFQIKNSADVEMLFKRYFDSPRGGGAKRVADYFETL